MTRSPTPVDLQRRGLDALIRELGYAGAVRFMLQFRRGHGDYTKERRRLLAGATVDDLLATSRRRQAAAKATGRRRKSA